MAIRNTPDQRHARSTLIRAALALIAAVGLAALLEVAVSRFWIRDATTVLVLGYLVVWVPLGGVIVWAFRSPGPGPLRRIHGLRLTPMDLLWGLGLGLLARVVATLLELAVYGQPGSVGAQLDPQSRGGAWLAIALIAPLLIAPVIEEIFFRGLLLGSLIGTDHRGRSLRASAAAIGVSSVAFALLHVALATSPSSAVVTGGATLVFAVASGTLAVATGRLGGCIIAHVAFNGLVVLPALV